MVRAEPAQGRSGLKVGIPLGIVLVSAFSAMVLVAVSLSAVHTMKAVEYPDDKATAVGCLATTEALVVVILGCTVYLMARGGKGYFQKRWKTYIQSIRHHRHQ